MSCVSLQNNLFTQSEVDDFLGYVDTAGAINGTLNISGTNAAPSATGEASIDNLRANGWTVTVTGGY